MYTQASRIHNKKGNIFTYDISKKPLRGSYNIPPYQQHFHYLYTESVVTIKYMAQCRRTRNTFKTELCIQRNRVKWARPV